MSLENKIEALTKQMERIADHLINGNAEPIKEATPSKPNVGKAAKAANDIDHDAVAAKTNSEAKRIAAQKKAKPEEEEAAAETPPIDFKELHQFFHNTLVMVKEATDLPTAQAECKVILKKYNKGATLTEGAVPPSKFAAIQQEVLDVRAKYGIE